MHAACEHYLRRFTRLQEQSLKLRLDEKPIPLVIAKVHIKLAAQNIANGVWAPGTTLLLRPRPLGASLAAAFREAPSPEPQSPASLARRPAVPSVPRTTPPGAGGRQLTAWALEPKPQEPANLGQAFGKAETRSQTAMRVIITEVVTEVSMPTPFDSSNVDQYSATAGTLGQAALSCRCAEELQETDRFGSQDLMNLAQMFAKLDSRTEVATGSTSTCAVGLCVQPNAQETGITYQDCSKVSIDGPSALAALHETPTACTSQPEPQNPSNAARGCGVGLVCGRVASARTRGPALRRPLALDVQAPSNAA